MFTFQWVLRALSPGLKPPGCKADHSHPTSVKVKNEWIYISIPPLWLRDVHRDKFTVALVPYNYHQLGTDHS